MLGTLLTLGMELLGMKLLEMKLLGIKSLGMESLASGVTIADGITRYKITRHSAGCSDSAGYSDFAGQ